MTNRTIRPMRSVALFHTLASLAALTLIVLACTASAQLPEMPAVDPIVKPATEQIEYNSWFLKTMVVRASTDKCGVVMIFHRYNYDRKLLSPDAADERTVTISDAYPLAGKYTVWQQTMAAIVRGAALAVREDEYTAKIAEIDRQIEQAKMLDPAADVSTLEAKKVPLQQGLEAVRQEMGPIQGVTDAEAR